MRLWPLLLGLSGSVQADQLLFTPTARHLPMGEIRAEAWFNDQPAAAAFTAGLGEAWDAEISVDRFGADPGRPTASLAYYYLSPIADISPGICVGILDAANETTDGRRIYACTTMNRSIRQTASLGFTELTAGLSSGRRTGPMAGFRTPIVRGISLLAEYDGFRFNEGLEAKLGGGAYARAGWRGAGFYLGLGFKN